MKLCYLKYDDRCYMNNNKFITWIYVQYIILIVCCSGLLWPPIVQTAPSIKIDKNTIELLNNGLKALVSIKQILSTLQTFNELHTMLKEQKQQQQQQQQLHNPNQISISGMPILLHSPTSTSSSSAETLDVNPATLLSIQPLTPLSNRPRANFVQKLFGKIPSLLLLPNVNNKSLNNKVTTVQRDPSLGLIKIGEKPPPGLFPETLPYSVSQFESSNEQSAASQSPSSINEQDAFKQLTSAVVSQHQKHHHSLDLDHNLNQQLSTSELEDKRIAQPINRFMYNKPSSFLTNKNQDEEETYGYFDHDTLIPYHYFSTSAFSAIPTKSLSSSIAIKRR